MIFVALAAICGLLAISPFGLSVFGRFLLAFVASSNWIYGSALLKGAVDNVGAVRFFANLHPDMLGGEVLTALMLSTIAIVAAYKHRAAATSIADSLASTQVPPLLFYSVLAYVSLGAVVSISSVGLDSLLSYSGYGSIKDRHEIYGDSVLLKFFAMTFRLATVVLISFAVATYVAGNRRYLAIASVPIVLAVAIGISEASRIVAIYFILSAVILFAGKRYLWATTLGLLGFGAIAYALGARGQVELGLLHFFDYLGPSLTTEDIFSRILTNTSAGMVTTSASLNVARPEAYDELFKFLSFLPTVDAMDGFQAAKATSEQRILPYIPFNAFAEAWAFGPIHFFAFWLIVYAAMSAVALSARRGMPLHFIMVALFLLALAIGSQYPIRNCLRYFYLVILLEPLLGYLQKRFGQGRRQKQDLERLPAVAVGGGK